MGDKKKKRISDIFDDLLDSISERAGEKLDRFGEKLEKLGEKLGEKLEVKFGTAEDEDPLCEGDDVAYNIKRLRTLSASARKASDWGHSLGDIIRFCTEAADAAALKGSYGAEVHVRIRPDDAELVAKLYRNLEPRYRRVLIDGENLTKGYTHTIYIDWAVIP